MAKVSTEATLMKKVNERGLGYSLIKIQIRGLLENGIVEK
jgi:hypothetical protein